MCNEQDDLTAARGIVTGLLLAIPMWAVIIVCGVYFFN